ncbi:gag-pol, partial [Mucuna pruriens]
MLTVDYVLRWVEAIATKTNDAKVVVDFLKSNIFCQFGVPKALISDQGSHFCNRAMSFLLHKYGVVHRVSIAYHPETNDQAGVFNREIKKTLKKMTNPNWKGWSRLLEDALWAHRTAYQTPLGMSPYQIVFGKACHLPMEIEHRAYWAVKQCNLAYDQARKQRKFQLQELNELHLEADENSQILAENPEERVPSWPESTHVQFTFKADRRMNVPTTPSRSTGIRLNYSMKVQHQYLNNQGPSGSFTLVHSPYQPSGLDSVTPSSTTIVMVDGDGPPPLARTLRIKSTRVRW